MGFYVKHAEEFNKKLKLFIPVIRILMTIRRDILKKILLKCVILAAVLMIVAGCSNSGTLQTEIPKIKQQVPQKKTGKI